MFAKLIKLFKRGSKKRKYSGLSDFFLRAPEDEKQKIITEAARRANEDQLRIFNRARIKTGF